MAEPTITELDPALANAIHTDQRPAWELNRDCAEMHLHILRAGTYLDRFGKEGQAGEPGTQYALRMNMSLAVDHCQDLIQLRVDNIFRTEPVRKFDDSPFKTFIAEFLADVDGGKTTMNAFMRRALVAYYTNGVDIVVDKARSDVEPENAAQEDALGMKPFLHAFGPLDRLDWSVDHAGRYLWVRYAMGQVPSKDELDQSGGQSQYLTLTPTVWRLYTVDTAEKDKKGKTTVIEGAHILGIVPVVTFYFKESQRADLPKVPLSLLTRIAPIARYLINLMSQIQIDIYRNIGFLVATGIEADQIPTEITPMGCWALPEGTTIEEIAGSVEHIKEKRELALMLMEAILRMGKLAGHSGDLKTRATSGVQVAVERTDLDNEMRMTAGQAEAVEREIIRMAVSRSTGKVVTAEDLQYNVEYNTKFVLTGVGEIVKNIEALVKTDVHTQVPEALKVLMRQLIGAMVSEDDDAFKIAMDEIDALVADAIVGSSESTDGGELAAID